MKLTSFDRITNNLIKMGYFPTTEEDALRIGSHMKGYSFSILDPCCGEGKALRTIAEGSGYPETLGIEIEETRANNARDNLDMVINDDFFNITIEPNSFSAVFLNPPYFANEQLHYPFVEKSTNILAKEGILILIIPEYELQGKTADFIASHYEGIKLFRSTDKTFKQVILFGVKKKKMELVDGAYLTRMARDAQEIPYNNHDDSKYSPPYTKSIDDVRIILKGIDTELLKTQLETFNDDWNKLISLIPEPLNTKRPLLPLRKGHLAQILASGMIDGVIEHPETRERYLIKGTTTRTEEILEETEEETRIITRDIVTILMMDQKGNIQQIK